VEYLLLLTQTSISSATHPTDLPDAVRILMYEGFSCPTWKCTASCARC
jgi:hypothetical protein